MKDFNPKLVEHANNKKLINLWFTAHKGVTLVS